MKTDQETYDTIHKNIDKIVKERIGDDKILNMRTYDWGGLPEMYVVYTKDKKVSIEVLDVNKFKVEETITKSIEIET